jgi:hypothetical protein
MPEFCLEGRDSVDFRKLPDILRGYIEAAFFTAPRPGEYGDHADADSYAIPEDYGFFDLAPEALQAMRKDCEAFERKHARALDALDRAESHYRGDYDREAAGRDLWFCRNGHGVGFWDRGFKGRAGAIAERLSEAARAMGESDLYRGDDSRVYVSL